MILSHFAEFFRHSWENELTAICKVKSGDTAQLSYLRDPFFIFLMQTLWLWLIKFIWMVEKKVNLLNLRQYHTKNQPKTNKIWFNCMLSLLSMKMAIAVATVNKNSTRNWTIMIFMMQWKQLQYVNEMIIRRTRQKMTLPTKKQKGSPKPTWPPTYGHCK